MGSKRRQTMARALKTRDYEILKEMFAPFAEDHTHAISYDDFREGFRLRESGSSIGGARPSPSSALLSYHLNRIGPRISAKTLFKQIDTDGDGEISIKELLVAFYPELTNKQIDRFIAKCEPSAADRRLSRKEAAEIQELFDLIDSDGNGELDLMEFKAYCASAEIDSATARQWFLNYTDEAGEAGSINFRKFTELYREVWGTDASTTFCLDACALTA